MLNSSCAIATTCNFHFHGCTPRSSERLWLVPSSVSGYHIPANLASIDFIQQSRGCCTLGVTIQSVSGKIKAAFQRVVAFARSKKKPIAAALFDASDIGGKGVNDKMWEQVTRVKPMTTVYRQVRHQRFSMAKQFGMSQRQFNDSHHQMIAHSVAPETMRATETPKAWTPVWSSISRLSQLTSPGESALHVAVVDNARRSCPRRGSDQASKPPA
jgi:hypothetical protein